VAGTTGSGDSPAQRLAVATLLRAARADLADARLVLRRGQVRNAAALGGRALSSLVHGVAASEHGWPMKDADARDIPADNPVQPELLATEALLNDAADQRVQPDGHPEQPPDAEDVADALDRLDEALETAVSQFGVDIGGTGPATNAEPIKPAEERPSPEPEGPAAEVEAALSDDEPVRRKAEAVSARPPRRHRRRLPPLAEKEINHEAKPPQAPSVVHDTPHSKSPRSRRASLPVTNAAAQDRQPAESDASADRPAVQFGPALTAPIKPRDITSTVFWALMDRWKLPDSEALNLIGHSGGLTKTGTRPRFKVVGKEAELFAHLREIDATLSPLVRDSGAWMRKPLKEAPFNGMTPLAYITQKGLEGAKAVERAVLMAGLQRRTVQLR
jgi:hypothetical protein